jgi:hypothetical protein
VGTAKPSLVSWLYQIHRAIISQPSNRQLSEKGLKNDLSRVNKLPLNDTLSPLEGDELLSYSNSVAYPRRDLLQEQRLIR